MSVFLIVGPKSTLAVSHAAPAKLWHRKPDHYIYAFRTLSAWSGVSGQHININTHIQNIKNIRKSRQDRENKTF